ncbi:hypothetical protein A2397_05590 [Candidatus Amesbacteria bacterium RIFOXYB1_FULL_44_23]|uniref:N-acetyltransferase domain-containing protein n=1 Tax=Candidatus Amesbacteria bacterium RIFOXYB1_FULL_44_23 TaxID=1797263 RepID=A0A1F4ZQA0_9BACT|nr:MAG: hypothetical protein A2397_05590 [Candidatus Amesbacteria bacterium RIFOXYB1_FULL_44_23]
MTPNLIIRALTPDEWPIFKKLRLESLADSPSAFSASPESLVDQPDSYWFDRLDTADKTFVAFMGKTPVGMASIYTKSNPKISHIAEAWGVYVSPKYRGQKIGKELLQTIIAEASSRSQFKKIRLGVTSSQSQAFGLYKSLGFVQVGCYKNEIRVGDKYFDEILMEKSLE